MTAVVALQKSMSHEFDKEMAVDASLNNKINQDNGSESKLNVEQKDTEMATTTGPSLESMGLQAEAEDDEMVTTQSENLNTSKGSSSKRKSSQDEKTFCETLLGEVNPNQQVAIDRISTLEGLEQMKKWLENARNNQQSKYLCMLLAQCWKANVTLDILSKTEIGKLMREFKKYPDQDVKTASLEVLKKWKSSVAIPEKTTKSAPVVSKPAPVQTTSIPSKPPPSAPIVPKVEKKNANVSRPKTARTKNTKFRKTGFEEDDEEDKSSVQTSKKPIPSVLSIFSTPITKSIVPKKIGGSAVVSNSFMNALSAGTSVNAVELQRKRKKPTPVIDLPLTSPMEPVVTTPTVPLVAGVREVDPNGPDPKRLPDKDNPRRIHFADDKGETLVHIKLIENVLLNKAHRPSADMKHADAEAERISLKKMKTGVSADEEDEEMRFEPPSYDEDNTWQLFRYSSPVCKEFNKELIDEENARYGEALRTFISHPDAPLEHPSEPDNTDFAYTQFHEAENIPIDFVPEDAELDSSEPMEVDVATSPEISSVQPAPSVSPAVAASAPIPSYTPPPVSTPTDVTNFQILSNVDIHGTGHAAQHQPRQVPIPFPINPPNYSVPPPNFSKPPPQPVPPPAPAEELIILDDQPSKLNAPRLSNTSSDDTTAFLQKLRGKKDLLDSLLGKVKGANVSNSPPQSSTAASSLNINFSVPPPAIPTTQHPIVHPVPPPVSAVPPPVGDFRILDDFDIHASKQLPNVGAPQHQPPPFQHHQPMMSGHQPPRQKLNRPPPGSSGIVCNFFLKGTCTFGANCYNQHVMPNQQQPARFGSNVPRFNNPHNPSMRGSSRRGGGIGAYGRRNDDGRDTRYHDSRFQSRDDKKYSSRRKRDYSNSRSPSRSPRNKDHDERRRSRSRSRSPPPRRRDYSKSRSRSRSRSPIEISD